MVNDPSSPTLPGEIREPLATPALHRRAAEVDVAAFDHLYGRGPHPGVGVTRYEVTRIGVDVLVIRTG